MDYVPMFGKFVGPWRPAFAWLPTRLFDGELVWLRKIVRRRVQKHDYLTGGPDQWWFYALPAVLPPSPRIGE